MTNSENISLTAIKTGSLLTVFTTLLLFGTSHHPLAWGFLIGALLSLFSLATLTVIVPFLFRPNAPRFMSALLVMTLFMKIPLFCIGLYVATHVRGIAPFASVLGIALAPMVIGMQAVRTALLEAFPARRSAQGRADAPKTVITETVIPAPSENRSSLPVTPEFAPERG